MKHHLKKKQKKQRNAANGNLHVRPCKQNNEDKRTKIVELTNIYY